MTRKQIKKAMNVYAKYTDEFWLDFAVQQVNAALEEAKMKIAEHFGLDQDGNHNGIEYDDPGAIYIAVDALKIP